MEIAKGLLTLRKLMLDLHVIALRVYVLFEYMFPPLFQLSAKFHLRDLFRQIFLKSYTRTLIWRGSIYLLSVPLNR
jgi:hypothetical protein